MKKGTENLTDNSCEQQIYKVTLIGSAANFVLLIIKFIAGFVGHSAAMIADSVHSLSDFATDIIVLLFVKIASIPADKNHDYGHGKFETLATAIIGIILFIVGGSILWNSSIKIYHVCLGESISSPGFIALAAALISIICKEGLYQYTIHKGKSLQSKILMANAWHHRSDALSSVGTLIGIGGAVLGGDKWGILDPIAAIIVSFLIMKVAIKLFNPSIDELLERSLPQETEEQIIAIINSFPRVNAPHSLCTRCIGNYYAIEVHILMDGNISLYEAHETSSAIEKKLKETFGEKTHISIHMEPNIPDTTELLSKK